MSKIWLTLFLVFAILDGLITRFGLQLGIEEGNPIARRNMDRAYVVEILLVAAYLWIFAASKDRNETINNGIRWGIKAGTIIFMLVVLSNMLTVLNAL